MVKSLDNSSIAFQQETRAGMQNLEKQIAQLAKTVNRMDKERGKLPAQAEINPRENTHAVTLRSGKELSALEERKNTICHLINEL